MDRYCTLVFLCRDDEILLAMKKRGFGEGHWNGVGGKIEPNESLEQALVRETEEEIGVTPLTWDKVAEHDFLMDSDSETPYHLYVHTFVCNKWRGEPSESEEMRPQWFSLDKIPYQQMWADDPFWLPQVLKNEKVVGKYTFNTKNKLLSYVVKVVESLPNDIPTHKPS
jgi:8-oxo-dGTP pyrophosphatase MutT (NUDIX family)